MKRDLPILFSPSMVRALLNDLKTMTRRVGDQTAFRNGPDGVEVWTGFMGWQTFEWAKENRGACGKGTMPSHVGIDRLWVREAWRTESRAYDDLAPSEMGGEETVLFEADAAWKHNKTVGRPRRGMHMPRWASRITLTDIDVRVERLQEISEADAIAEGCVADDANLNPNRIGPARSIFEGLWDSLNAERGYGWATNPWVTVTTFAVDLRNIDQIGAG
ncbi:hypothetical protein [Aminobacter aminovorans]|uniref:Morphogenetic protein n=1 Tax=Aminobacter aminovorans TaxID=83263 RepID=A0AAC9FDK2_AMIAI|nr:hypothetical protein [Aminobacter aminovorans]AMS41235.1 hypothetical protein AA2016_2307 [Aminobacter aminovorans]MBB3705783.1 hypothetical protein [Aminobacter aminovorans]